MERCQKDLPKDDVAVDELWEEGQPPNAVVLALMNILFWPPSHALLQTMNNPSWQCYVQCPATLW